MVEWWFNTHYHTGLNMSPFKALYGYDPPHAEFLPSSSCSVAEISNFLQHREATLEILKESLFKAQERMKWYADKKRTDRQFNVGDWFTLSFNLTGRPRLLFART